MVSFGTIEIREYNRVLDGDNIDVRHALTIGWEFEQCPPISMQDEINSESSNSSLSETTTSTNKSLSASSCSSSSSSSSFSSSGYAIPRSKDERKRILYNFGYSKKELTQAEKDRIRRLKGKAPKHLEKQEVQDDLAVPSSSSFLKLRFLRLPIKPLNRV